MPIHTYTKWNVRPSDAEEQIEPFRKYFFICEGANTETFYFRKLIDLRKTLNIHPLIDIRLMEKTEEHSNISYPKQLLAFAETLKDDETLDFDKEHDKMIVIFDADIFEEKVSGYEDLIKEGEKSNIIGITNPGFEVFLLLHIEGAYEKYIKDNNDKFFELDEKKRFRHPYNVLLEATGMNSKKNSKIGDLAENVAVAIEQEKSINQDVHNVKGVVSSNIASIIEGIIADRP